MLFWKYLFLMLTHPWHGFGRKKNIRMETVLCTVGDGHYAYDVCTHKHIKLLFFLGLKNKHGKATAIKVKFFG